MERELAELARLERENDDVPDRAAACCGRLMAEVFHWRDDRWTETVEQMAFALGEFVYLQDACVDLEKDLRKHRYNPLLALWKEPRPLAEYEPMLLMLAGQCAGSFERLPLVRDAGILKISCTTGCGAGITRPGSGRSSRKSREAAPAPAAMTGPRPKERRLPDERPLCRVGRQPKRHR